MNKNDVALKKLDFDKFFFRQKNDIPDKKKLAILKKRTSQSSIIL